ncbi:MAG: hypothetical protein WBD31_21465 [Rubripirellula sp.]
MWVLHRLFFLVTRRLCPSVLAFVVCFTSDAIVSADDKTNSSPPQKVSVTIRQKSPFHFEGVLQIDGLETGKAHVVQMMLANETSETLDLENSNSTYHLIKVRPSQPTLAPGQSCRVELVLPPQANFTKHVWAQQILFPVAGGDRGASATLEVSSKLKGLFSVSPDSVLLIASTLKGESQTKFAKLLSVTYSPPVDPKNFRFSGSDMVNLLDIGVTNRGSDGRAEIEVAAELDFIPTEGVHGDLEITDTVTNKVRVVHITMVQRSRIRVLPSKLVFRPVR